MVVLAQALGDGAVPRGADGVIQQEATGTKLLRVSGGKTVFETPSAQLSCLLAFFSAVIVSVCQALCLSKAYS